MKAVVFKNQDKGCEYIEDFELPEGNTDWKEVNLYTAALNKRDDFILKGLYPGIKNDIVLGSDGAGYCDDQKVLINPGLNWGTNEAFQSEDFYILGMPGHGTFSEKIRVPSSNIRSIPPHLSMEEAAALPLAGLTAYRAVFTKGDLQAGQQVLITGGGGGVALNCIQFSLAAEAEVFCTTGSTEKAEKLEAMGVRQVVNYKKENWGKMLKSEAGLFDLIVDGAGGEGLARLIGLLKPGGKLVIYGGTTGKSNNISPQLIFWRQLHIMGTSMGSIGDFQNMLHFVKAHQIKPIVDSVFDLKDFHKAFERIRSGDHFGKIVLRVRG
ncbi:MAG: alcohol dehydrogenase [Saprospirales bacterium]|nr:MAG: alcohol dehydrogenase [Saprospirales bacterium]